MKNKKIKYISILSVMFTLFSYIISGFLITRNNKIENVLADAITQSEETITISSEEGWYRFIKDNSTCTKNIELTADLDFTAENADYFQAFEEFSGTLNGNGFSITGADMLMKINNGDIYNLVLRNSVVSENSLYIYQTWYSAGAVCGVNNGRIIGVGVEGAGINFNETDLDYSTVGGITGINYGTIQDCYVYNSEVEAYNGSEPKNKIYWNNLAGGITGYLVGGAISNCILAGNTITSNGLGEYEYISQKSMIHFPKFDDIFCAYTATTEKPFDGYYDDIMYNSLIKSEKAEVSSIWIDKIRAPHSSLSNGYINLQPRLLGGYTGLGNLTVEQIYTYGQETNFDFDSLKESENDLAYVYGSTDEEIYVADVDELEAKTLFEKGRFLEESKTIEHTFRFDGNVPNQTTTAIYQQINGLDYRDYKFEDLIFQVIKIEEDYIDHFVNNGGRCIVDNAFCLYINEGLLTDIYHFVPYCLNTEEDIKNKIGIIGVSEFERDAVFYTNNTYFKGSDIYSFYKDYMDYLDGDDSYEFDRVITLNYNSYYGEPSSGYLRAINTKRILYSDALHYFSGVEDVTYYKYNTDLITSEINSGNLTITVAQPSWINSIDDLDSPNLKPDLNNIKVSKAKPTDIGFSISKLTTNAGWFKYQVSSEGKYELGYPFISNQYGDSFVIKIHAYDTNLWKNYDNYYTTDGQGNYNLNDKYLLEDDFFATVGGNDGIRFMFINQVDNKFFDETSVTSLRKEVMQEVKSYTLNGETKVLRGYRMRGQSINLIDAKKSKDGSYTFSWNFTHDIFKDNKFDATKTPATLNLLPVYEEVGVNISFEYLRENRNTPGQSAIPIEISLEKEYIASPIYDNKYDTHFTKEDFDNSVLGKITLTPSDLDISIFTFDINFNGDASDIDKYYIGATITQLSDGGSGKNILSKHIKYTNSDIKADGINLFNGWANNQISLNFQDPFADKYDITSILDSTTSNPEYLVSIYVYEMKKFTVFNMTDATQEAYKDAEKYPGFSKKSKEFGILYNTNIIYDGTERAGSDPLGISEMLKTSKVSLTLAGYFTADSKGNELEDAVQVLTENFKCYNKESTEYWNSEGKWIYEKDELYLTARYTGLSGTYLVNLQLLYGKLTYSTLNPFADVIVWCNENDYLTSIDVKPEKNHYGLKIQYPTMEEIEEMNVNQEQIWRTKISLYNFDTEEEIKTILTSPTYISNFSFDYIIRNANSNFNYILYQKEDRSDAKLYNPNKPGDSEFSYKLDCKLMPNKEDETKLVEVKYTIEELLKLNDNANKKTTIAYIVEGTNYFKLENYPSSQNFLGYYYEKECIHQAVVDSKYTPYNDYGAEVEITFNQEGVAFIYPKVGSYLIRYHTKSYDTGLTADNYEIPEELQTVSWTQEADKGLLFEYATSNTSARMIIPELTVTQNKNKDTFLGYTINYSSYSTREILQAQRLINLPNSGIQDIDITTIEGKKIDQAVVINIYEVWGEELQYRVYYHFSADSYWYELPEVEDQSINDYYLLEYVPNSIYETVQLPTVVNLDEVLSELKYPSDWDLLSYTVSGQGYDKDTLKNSQIVELPAIVDKDEFDKEFRAIHIYEVWGKVIQDVVKVVYHSSATSQEVGYNEDDLDGYGFDTEAKLYDFNITLNGESYARYDWNKTYSPITYYYTTSNFDEYVRIPKTSNQIPTPGLTPTGYTFKIGSETKYNWSGITSMQIKNLKEYFKIVDGEQVLNIYEVWGEVSGFVINIHYCWKNGDDYKIIESKTKTIELYDDMPRERSLEFGNFVKDGVYYTSTKVLTAVAVLGPSNRAYELDKKLESIAHRASDKILFRVYETGIPYNADPFTVYVRVAKYEQRSEEKDFYSYTSIFVSNYGEYRKDFQNATEATARFHSTLNPEIIDYSNKNIEWYGEELIVDEQYILKYGKLFFIPVHYLIRHTWTEYQHEEGGAWTDHKYVYSYGGGEGYYTDKEIIEDLYEGSILNSGKITGHKYSYKEINFLTSKEYHSLEYLFNKTRVGENEIITLEALEELLTKKEEYANTNNNFAEDFNSLVSILSQKHYLNPTIVEELLLVKPHRYKFKEFITLDSRYADNPYPAGINHMPAGYIYLNYQEGMTEFYSEPGAYTNWESEEFSITFKFNLSGQEKTFYYSSEYQVSYYHTNFQGYTYSSTRIYQGPNIGELFKNAMEEFGYNVNLSYLYVKDYEVRPMYVDEGYYYSEKNKTEEFFNDLTRMIYHVDYDDYYEEYYEWYTHSEHLTLDYGTYGNITYYIDFKPFQYALAFNEMNKDSGFFKSDMFESDTATYYDILTDADKTIDISVLTNLYGEYIDNYSIISLLDLINEQYRENPLENADGTMYLAGWSLRPSIYLGLGEGYENPDDGEIYQDPVLYVYGNEYSAIGISKSEIQEILYNNIRYLTDELRRGYYLTDINCFATNFILNNDSTTILYDGVIRNLYGYQDSDIHPHFGKYNYNGTELTTINLYPVWLKYNTVELYVESIAKNYYRDPTPPNSSIYDKDGNLVTDLQSVERAGNCVTIKYGITLQDSLKLYYNPVAGLTNKKQKLDGYSYVNFGYQLYGFKFRQTTTYNYYSPSIMETSTWSNQTNSFGTEGGMYSIEQDYQYTDIIRQGNVEYVDLYILLRQLLLSHVSAKGEDIYYTDELGELPTLRVCTYWDKAKINVEVDPDIAYADGNIIESTSTVINLTDDSQQVETTLVPNFSLYQLLHNSNEFSLLSADNLNGYSVLDDDTITVAGLLSWIKSISANLTVVQDESGRLIPSIKFDAKYAGNLYFIEVENTSGVGINPAYDASGVSLGSLRISHANSLKKTDNASLYDNIKGKAILYKGKIYFCLVYNQEVYKGLTSVLPILTKDAYTLDYYYALGTDASGEVNAYDVASKSVNIDGIQKYIDGKEYVFPEYWTDTENKLSASWLLDRFNANIDLGVLLADADSSNAYLVSSVNFDGVNTYYVVRYSKDGYSTFSLTEEKYASWDKTYKGLSVLGLTATPSSVITAPAGAKISIECFDQSKDISLDDLIGYRHLGFSMQSSEAEKFPLNEFVILDNVTTTLTANVLEITLGELKQHINFKVRGLIEKIKYSIVIKTEDTNSTITSNGETAKNITISDLVIGDSVTAVFNEGEKREFLKWVYLVNGINSDFSTDKNLSFEINAEFLKTYAYKGLASYPVVETQDLGEMIAESRVIPFYLTLNLQTMLEQADTKAGYILLDINGTYILVEFDGKVYNAWMLFGGLTKKEELEEKGIEQFLKDNPSLVSLSEQSATATLILPALAGSRIGLTFIDQAEDSSSRLIGYKLKSIDVKNDGWFTYETYDGIVDATSLINTNNNYGIRYSNSSIYSWEINFEALTKDASINLVANYEKIEYSLNVFTTAGTIQIPNGEKVQNATYTFNINDKVKVEYFPTDVEHELWQWIFTPDGGIKNIWAEYINPIEKTIDASILVSYCAKDSSFYTEYKGYLGSLEATERKKPDSFRLNLDIEVLLESDGEEDSTNSFVALERGGVYYIIRYIDGGYKYTTTNDLNNISFNSASDYTRSTIQLESNSNINVYFFDQSKNVSQEEFIGYRLNGIRISESGSASSYGATAEINGVKNALSNITYNRIGDLYKLTIEIGELVEEQDEQTLTITELITPIKYSLTFKPNNADYGTVEANGKTELEVLLNNLSVLDNRVLDNSVSASAKAKEHYEYINWMYLSSITGAVEEEYSREPDLTLRVEELVKSYYLRKGEYPVADQDLGVFTANFERIQYKVNINLQVLLDNLKGEHATNAYLVANLEGRYYAIKYIDGKYKYETFAQKEDINISDVKNGKVFNETVLKLRANSNIEIEVYDQSKAHDENCLELIGYRLKGIGIVRAGDLNPASPFAPYLVGSGAVSEEDESKKIIYSISSAGYTIGITTGELTDNHSVEVKAIIEKIQYKLTARTKVETGTVTGSINGTSLEAEEGREYSVIETSLKIDDLVTFGYTAKGRYEVDYWLYSLDNSRTANTQIQRHLSLDDLQAYYNNYCPTYSVADQDLGIYEAIVKEQAIYYTVNLNLAVILRDNGLESDSDNGYLLINLVDEGKYYAYTYSQDLTKYLLYEITEEEYKAFNISVLESKTAEIDTLVQVPSKTSVKISVYDQSKDTSQDRFIGYRFKGMVIDKPGDDPQAEYLNDETPIEINTTENYVTYTTENNGYTLTVAIGDRIGDNANSFEDMTYTAILEKINYKLTFNVDSNKGNIDVSHESTHLNGITEKTFENILINESLTSKYNPSIGYEIDYWGLKSIVLKSKSLSDYNNVEYSLGSGVRMYLTIDATFLREHIYSKLTKYPVDLNQNLGSISAIAKLIEFDLEVRIEEESGAELLTYRLSEPKASIVDLSYNGEPKTKLTLNESYYLISLNLTDRVKYKCYTQDGIDYAVLEMYVKGTANSYENKKYDFPIDSYESISIKIDQSMLQNLVRYSLGEAITEENRVIDLVINVAEIFELAVVEDSILENIDENDPLKGERSLLVRNTVVAKGVDGTQVKGTADRVQYAYLGQEVAISVNNFSNNYYSKAIISDATLTADPFETKELLANQSFTLEVKEDTVINVKFEVRKYSLSCEIVYNGSHHSLDNYRDVKNGAGIQFLTTKPTLTVLDSTGKDRVSDFYYEDIVKLTFGLANFNPEMLNGGKLTDYSYLVKVNGRVIKDSNKDGVFETTFKENLIITIEILDIAGKVYISNNIANVGDVVVSTAKTTYRITEGEIGIELEPAEKLTVYIQTDLGFAFDNNYTFNGEEQEISSTIVTAGVYAGYLTFDLIPSYTSTNQGIYILNFIEREVTIDLKYYVNGEEDIYAGTGYTATPTVLKVTETTKIEKGKDNAGYRFVGYSIGLASTTDVIKEEGTICDYIDIRVSDYIDYIQDNEGSLSLPVYINYIRQYNITVRATNANLGTNVVIKDTNNKEIMNVKNSYQLPKTTEYIDQFDETSPVYYDVTIESKEHHYFKFKINGEEIKDDVIEVIEVDAEELGIQEGSIEKTANYNFKKITYRIKLDKDYTIDITYNRESYKTKLTEYLITEREQLDNYINSGNLDGVASYEVADAVVNANVSSMEGIELIFNSTTPNEYGTEQTMRITIKEDANYEIYKVILNGKDVDLEEDESGKKLTYEVKDMQIDEEGKPSMKIEIIYKQVYTVDLTTHPRLDATE